MKTKIKIILFITLCCSIFSIKAQVNFDFTSEGDLTYFKPAQCTLSIVDNQYLKMAVTGNFWAVAPYEPVGGVVWNFDAYKVVVIKEQNKYGDLYLKLFNSVDGSERKLRDSNPLTVTGSNSLIHVIAFENYAETYPDIQSGTMTFTNVQIAHEYVSPGTEILVDFIRSFPTIEAAYEFVLPLLDGETAVKNIDENPIQIYSVGSSIKIAKMEREERVDVMDIKGAVIKSQTMMNGEITNLKKGFYLVKVGSKTVKVMI